jgi:hypothetical protein
MKNYNDIIKENDNQGAFNDADNLLDFLNNYLSKDEETLEDIKYQDDNIAEFVDGLCPIYYYDIVKQWQENTDCHELTLEVCGEYNQKDGIYRMMTSDLYFYYEQQLREDFDKLVELMDKEARQNNC